MLLFLERFHSEFAEAVLGVRSDPREAVLCGLDRAVAEVLHDLPVVHRHEIEHFALLYSSN